MRSKRMGKRILTAVLAAAMLLTQPGVVSASETVATAEAPAGEVTDYITDGSFETDMFNNWTADNWDAMSLEKQTGTVGDTVSDSTYDGSTMLKFWSENGGTAVWTQTIANLPAGSYKLIVHSNGGDGETVSPYFNGTLGSNTQQNSGWNVWTESSNIFTLTEAATDVKVGVNITCTKGGWGKVDGISLVATNETEEAVPAAESNLYVKKVSGIDEDFIRGVDISSVKAEYDSGVKYYDFDGNELVFDDTADTSKKTFFEFLKECGVNWVRVRVWNNPYLSTDSSKGYGGGNNDLAKAVEIGKSATAAGLKVLVDFHYSDFWADPNMQAAPKAWTAMTLDEKATAVNAFTTDSLNTLFDAGVDVGMVQVGNETNNGICGVTPQWIDSTLDLTDMAKIYNAGSSAVRAVAAAKEKNIMVAIHYTNVQDAGYYDSVAAALSAAAVDYDVFATSYYPFWHGTTTNLTTVMKTIADTYNKKVMVAETSYAYTLEDSDGHENNVRADATGLTYNYNTSVQGQANAVADVIQAVANMGDAGIGMFYWEPAWTTVGKYDKTAANAADVLAANKVIWEANGSGWASSYSGEYDEDNAGKWFGGSSWDNQAMFNADGNPLESINVYKYVFTGTTAEPVVESVNDIEQTVLVSDAWTMPATVAAKYTDNSENQVAVVWDDAQVAAAKETGVGTYTIDGTVTANEKEYNLTCKLIIQKPNLLVNSGFEEEDMSVWTIDGAGVGRTADSNKRTGDYSLKYWSDSPVEFTAEQKVTLDAGTYTLSAYTQGAVADNGDNAVYRLYATVGDITYAIDTTVSSWQNWTNPTLPSITVPADGTVVTIGVYTSANPGAWGAWDDFYLREAEDEDIYTEDYSDYSVEFVGDDTYTYTGSAIEPAVEVKKDGVVVTIDQPSVTYSNNTNVGTATVKAFIATEGTETAAVTITGQNQFTIEAADQELTLEDSYDKIFGDAAFDLKAVSNVKDAAFTYASSNKAVADVDAAGKVTIKGAGTATITVTATAANYETVTETTTITVDKADQTIKASDVKKTYGNKAFNISADAEGALTYTSSKSSVVTVGKTTGKVTIKGTGVATITIKAAATANYEAATKKITITVAPKKAAISKLTSTVKKTMKVTWKKDSKASGYVVEYSTSKKFKNAKKVTITSNKTTAKTIKKLSSGKKYYVRVRAYKKNGKSRIYGTYSSVKTKKIK